MSLRSGGCEVGWTMILECLSSLQLAVAKYSEQPPVSEREDIFGRVVLADADTGLRPPGIGPQPFAPRTLPTEWSSAE
jgi:hypothetical protein